MRHPPLPCPLPLPSPFLSSVPPYTPTGLTVTGVTTTSFQLTWTNPFSGNTDLSTATVTLTSVNDSTTLQANTLTSHHFEGLVPNRDYQVEVVVSNTVGSSPPGSTTTRTLPLGKTPLLTDTYIYTKYYIYTLDFKYAISLYKGCFSTFSNTLSYLTDV